MNLRAIGSQLIALRKYSYRARCAVSTPDDIQLRDWSDQMFLYQKQHLKLCVVLRTDKNVFFLLAACVFLGWCLHFDAKQNERYEACGT